MTSQTRAEGSPWIRAWSMRADTESPGSVVDGAADGFSLPAITAACADLTPAWPQLDSVMARATPAAPKRTVAGPYRTTRVRQNRRKDVARVPVGTSRYGKALCNETGMSVVMESRGRDSPARWRCEKCFPGTNIIGIYQSAVQDIQVIAFASEARWRQLGQED
jgi:hypothetical protein